MINLIPPQGKSVTKFEYRVRVFTVWCFLVGGVSVAAIFLHVPSYVLVTSHVDALNEEINAIHDDEASFKEAEAAIVSANAVITQLLKPSSSVVVSEIITEIMKAANDGIVVNRFMLTANTDIERMKKEGKWSVQVQGKSTTRESLAHFKSALERSESFESASVPISDLARESELPFVVTLILKQSL